MKQKKDSKKGKDEWEYFYQRANLLKNPLLDFCIVQFVCIKNFQSECVIKIIEGACWLTQI